MLDQIGDAVSGFFGGNRKRPTISAEQLGFNQADYDKLKARREGYTSKFEGEEGFEGRARGLGDQYAGFLGRITDEGGLYDQALDPNAMMQDQALYQGLLEQQRASQDRANQEMLSRQLSQSGQSPSEVSGFLSRFQSMTDPLGEQRAADALQAANMSMQNRGSMLDRGANLLSQGGNFLSGQSAMLGQEANYGSFGYQDALNQMQAMDDARMAALNMDYQGKMADYNKPTGFDQLVGLAGGIGSLAGGLGTFGQGGGFAGIMGNTPKP